MLGQVMPRVGTPLGFPREDFLVQNVSTTGFGPRDVWDLCPCSFANDSHKVSFCNM